MARTLGPVMWPLPRAGSAMVRDSSSSTMTRASTDKPPPPIFLRDVHHPEAEVLGALAEALVIFRLELLGALEHRLALDRNQLGVDEAPQRFLEDAQFVGKIEIHHRLLLVVVPQHAHVDGDRAGARTISGLISISRMRAR